MIQTIRKCIDVHIAIAIQVNKGVKNKLAQKTKYTSCIDVPYNHKTFFTSNPASICHFNIPLLKHIAGNPPLNPPFKK